MYPMNKEWVLTQESFDALLAWLDSDRERAGQQYEAIRKRLIKMFACRGCAGPEDLADETINRVTNRLSDIESSFIGERSRYFYGVANKVYLEYLRRKPPPQVQPLMDDTAEKEQEYDCLERCMQGLTADNRKLVLEYYQEEKQAKIDHRKRLAEQLGIALNALRIRAHRIRISLQECVQNCVQSASA
jgi:DNA-directed RNA polymerase specialized sigma24 family protein